MRLFIEQLTAMATLKGKTGQQKVVDGTSPVVVLSYDFWKTQLGNAPDQIAQRAARE